MAVEIDGSQYEGGGGMLRNAIALSLYTGKPLRIYNIRANRKRPGLLPQHMASVMLAQKISGSSVQGLGLGSNELLFMPQKARGGTYEIDIGTAGSIPLMLQSILLPCILSGSKYIIRAKGGTDVPYAMSIDYFGSIFSYAAKEYASIEPETIRRGYYPEGGGRADIIINSRFTEFDREDFSPIIMDGDMAVQKVSVRMNASKSLSSKRILEQIQDFVSIDIAKKNYDHSITSYYQESIGEGISILLSIAGISNGNERMIGETLIYDKKAGAQQIAEEIMKRAAFHTDSKAPCDYHLADQLIGLLCAMGGRIRTSKITDHALSNIYVCQKFTKTEFSINHGMISAVNQ
jgi:RNA 3'-terminal phosphate cyclase (ATP)